MLHFSFNNFFYNPKNLESNCCVSLKHPIFLLQVLAAVAVSLALAEGDDTGPEVTTKGDETGLEVTTGVEVHNPELGTCHDCSCVEETCSCKPRKCAEAQDR